MFSSQQNLAKKNRKDLQTFPELLSTSPIFRLQTIAARSDPSNNFNDSGANFFFSLYTLGDLTIFQPKKQPTGTPYCI